MTKAGFAGSVLIFLMASSSVPMAFGLAGLSKPTWLSLICRNVSPLAGAACASPMMPTERGTPPATVHSTPVPAQVMHSRILRLLTPSSRCEVIPISFAALLACLGKTGEGQDLFPRGWRSPFRGHLFATPAGRDLQMDWAECMIAELFTLL